MIWFIAILYILGAYMTFSFLHEFSDAGTFINVVVCLIWPLPVAAMMLSGFVMLISELLEKN